MKTRKPKAEKRKTSARPSWPVTYKWLATGALVAYTAVGSKTVTPAYAQESPAPVETADAAQREAPHRIRTDLSATLFFTGPDEYDGGELQVEDTYGAHSVKLEAGHMVIYPSTSLHRVTPTTRGARIAAFFWIQSMIRDDGQRTLLFDLDTAIQRVAADMPDHPSAVQLTGVYHDLLRRWADV